jgi:glycosyltransferase involved in cell wall biosynthesis
MTGKRRSVCIISFSPVSRDARVLRQIEFLAARFRVTAIGQGERPHAGGRDLESVEWAPVAPVAGGRWLSKSTGLGLLLAGRLTAAAFERWYWRQPVMLDALAKAVASRADAFHANDWNTLPVAAEAARRLGARLVFDDHEYAPLEFENSRAWRAIYAPAITHLVRRYAARADLMITVAPAIAERYREEFGLSPVVVMNAPGRAANLPERGTDFSKIRLIHHGAAIPGRRLEVMIEALSLSDRRYSLHFMLTAADVNYVARLRRAAEELAPGRVVFHDPVPTDGVLARVAEFDMGLCYIAPTLFSYLVSLPNKFFDFIAAGLPVCTGPSPSMAEIVNAYGLGCVARSFEARDVAAALNGLTAAQFAAMREGARRAAREINAEREMGKLVSLYEGLLSGR